MFTNLNLMSENIHFRCTYLAHLAIAVTRIDKTLHLTKENFSEIALCTDFYCTLSSTFTFSRKTDADLRLGCVLTVSHYEYVKENKLVNITLRPKVNVQ